MKATFSKIYTDNAWGHGSGAGSLPKHNTSYMAFLERFLRERGVGSVVDVGCGDWQFSRSIDWSGTSYLGLDVVESVIDANTRQFARDGVRFESYSGDPTDVPDADLLIAKDVMQHWSNAAISAFLRQLPRYRYALLTNCIAPDRGNLNADIDTGGFRPLDLTRDPFSLRAEPMLTYSKQRPWPLSWLRRNRSWIKQTLLVKGDA